MDSARDPVAAHPGEAPSDEMRPDAAGPRRVAPDEAARGDGGHGEAVHDGTAQDDAPLDDQAAAQARLALETLAELDAGNGVSLPRLAKRTGLRVSVLLRLYTLMSDARVGAEAGPGWARLHVDEDGRWIAHITPAGRGDPEDSE